MSSSSPVSRVRTRRGHITTLGRGGSDLTAIALAAALKADRCEIYTDVDGVYTADPRVVKSAKKIDEISYDEMLELASLGAKVMQARSGRVREKVQGGVRGPLQLQSESGNPRARGACENGRRGTARRKPRKKSGEGDHPRRARQTGRGRGIFSALAAAGTNVDMIVQNIATDGTTDMTFTVAQDDLPAARKVIDAQSAQIGAKSSTAKSGISKLSVVGIGMRSHTGVAATLFQALAQAGINIQMISTSEIKISVIIDEAEGGARHHGGA